jgi:hypothetical protein
MNEQAIIILKAELLEIEIRLQSAIAENKQREHLGQSMAYDNFDDLAQEARSALERFYKQS